MQTFNCPYCNSPVRPNAKFCRTCGKPLPVPPQQPTPPPPPAAPPAQPAPPPGYAPPPPVPQAPARPASPPAPPAIEQIYAPPPPRPLLKRPSTWLIFGVGVLICLVCVIALVVGGYLAYDRGFFDTFLGSPIATTRIVEAEVIPSNTPRPSDTPRPTQTPSPPPSAESTVSVLPTLTPIIIPGLNIEIPHVTDEEDVEIGRQAAAEFETYYSLSHDAATLERVNRLAATILPQQPRSTIPFTFQVLETDEVNAFALPGGFIYITTGLIDFVESDDELAGVIAHEIAHVSLRHGAQQIEYIAAAEAAIAAMATSDPNFETIYQDESAQIAITLAGQIALSGWGREAELDADEYGAIYMFYAGYDVQAMIDLFTRFMAYEEASSGDIMEQLLATHPPFADRIVNVQEAIITHSLTR